MKAIVLKQFGGTDNFRLEDVEEPQLQPGSVKIKIKATAFNPIDYQMRRGSSESKLLRSVILGREMSGVIIEVHPSVTNFKVGDEVYSYTSNLASNGSYAQFIVVPEIIIAHKPANLSFKQAAGVSLVGLTALQAVERCAIKKDDTVFVTGGAGGVGSMVIRLLLHKGFDKIFTTAGNTESRHKIMAYGLPKDHILDYREEDLAGKLISRAGTKPDYCIDTVGGKMADLCAEVIKINGTFADITYLLSSEARELLFDKGATIINISNFAYGLDGDPEQMKYYGVHLTMLKEYFEQHSLPQTPINVLGNLSVDTVARAHEILENNAARGYKLVMEIET